jgi:hypothetical protein
MPQWIHNRAEHLLAKNPSMDESEAFAIATQQSHSLGKSPKGYGTAAGRKKAKAKFDKPKKEYVKTPNPGKLESPKMAAWEHGVDYGRLGVEPVQGVEDIKKGQDWEPYHGRWLSLNAAMRGTRPGLLKRRTPEQLERAKAIQSEMDAIDAFADTPEYGALTAPKMASAFLGSFTELMLKKANGDDDEKGRRQLTSKDKTDVAKFMLKRPKGQKDEKFHAFVEAKGMNPHGAEETVYDLLGKCAAEHKDKIPGGKADKASPKDFPKDQMSMGQKVEMEHTNDPTLSREIASDHLEEFRDYYTRLKQMEQEAEKAKEKRAAPRWKKIPGAAEEIVGRLGAGSYATLHPGNPVAQARSALRNLGREGQLDVNPLDVGIRHRALVGFPSPGKREVKNIIEGSREFPPLPLPGSKVASAAQAEKALRMLRVGAEKARSFAAGAKRPVKLDPRLKKVAEVDPYWFMLEELEKMAAQTAVKPLNTLDPGEQLKDSQSVGLHKPLKANAVKLTEYKPINFAKVGFQVSEYSGPLSMGSFSYRNPQFQSSLPGAEKLSGPDPEAEEGDREHFPDNEKKASLWKAAHFACSAIGRWQEKNRH